MLRGALVGGVEVTFTVTKGGGTVTDVVVPTGDDGVATVGYWILGPTPGEKELKAEVPGLAPVFYCATGRSMTVAPLPRSAEIFRWPELDLQWVLPPA
jgi:hypothetical protein